MKKGKIKILWLCHFTNPEVQAQLPLWKKNNEFAPWIPNTAKGFEDKVDYELHIVCPHEYLQKSTDFVLRNVHYHFIPYGIPLWHRHWPALFRFDIFSNFYFFRKAVKKLTQRIQPDIINLIGAENDYYATAVFNIQKLAPVIVGIQGFISQLKGHIELNNDSKKRIETEIKILKEFEYFYGEKDSSTYINEFNPGHKFYKIFFPANEELALKTVFKGHKYDLVFFGRINSIKGSLDFVKAIAEIRTEKPYITAIMIGDGDIDEAKQLAQKFDCINNIEFTGFVKTQEEMFELVIASKVFLVPPYFERLSSTIREAMYLKVPIVAYATGGIPYLNEFDENVLLVSTGDYKAMAQKALTLLNDEEKRLALAEKAFSYAVSEFSLKVNAQRLIEAYNEVISLNT